MGATPRMRRDIKPLCPLHHMEMVLADLEKEKYSCIEKDCTVSWRAVYEYQRFVEDSSFPIENQDPDLVSCRRVGHGHMFVSRFDQERNAETWQCSIENCSEEEERPLRGWAPRNRYQQMR